MRPWRCPRLVSALEFLPAFSPPPLPLLPLLPLGLRAQLCFPGDDSVSSHLPVRLPQMIAKRPKGNASPRRCQGAQDQGQQPCLSPGPAAHSLSVARKLLGLLDRQTEKPEPPWPLRDALWALHRLPISFSSHRTRRSWPAPCPHLPGPGGFCQGGGQQSWHAVDRPGWPCQGHWFPGFSPARPSPAHTRLGELSCCPVPASHEPGLSLSRGPHSHGHSDWLSG